MKMTKKDWNQLRDVLEMGDPVKDVIDEQGLIDYIFELRKRLKLEDDQP